MSPTWCVWGFGPGLARALAGLGSIDDAAASVRAHLDVGADHVVVQVLDDNPMADPPPALRTLAQALELG